MRADMTFQTTDNKGWMRMDVFYSEIKLYLFICGSKRFFE